MRVVKHAKIVLAIQQQLYSLMCQNRYQLLSSDSTKYSIVCPTSVTPKIERYLIEIVNIRQIDNRSTANDKREPFACLTTNLCLKSGYSSRLGNPLRQIRMPSSTPLQVSWLSTRFASMTPKRIQFIELKILIGNRIKVSVRYHNQYIPDAFFSLGIMHRMKCGCV